MDTIWKYQVQITDTQEIEMPSDSNILHFGKQNEIPTLWVGVNSASPKRKRTFKMFGTGHPIPEDAPDMQYVGTVLMLGDRLVWHLFVVS